MIPPDEAPDDGWWSRCHLVKGRGVSVQVSRNSLVFLSLEIWLHFALYTDSARHHEAAPRPPPLWLLCPGGSLESRRAPPRSGSLPKRPLQRRLREYTWHLEPLPRGIATYDDDRGAGHGIHNTGLHDVRDPLPPHASMARLTDPGPPSSTFNYYNSTEYVYTTPSPISTGTCGTPNNYDSSLGIATYTSGSYILSEVAPTTAPVALTPRQDAEQHGCRSSCPPFAQGFTDACSCFFGSGGPEETVTETTIVATSTVYSTAISTNYVNSTRTRTVAGGRTHLLSKPRSRPCSSHMRQPFFFFFFFFT
jgi:hypothetical protein